MTNKLLGYMYDFYNQHTLKGQNDDILYYQKLLQKYHPQNILIVGAGTGRVAIPLSEKVEIVALDFDKGRLEILNEKNNLIKTVCTDFIDYQTNTKFDMVIFPYSTLQFSNDPKKLNQIFKKTKEITNNKSIVIFDVSDSFEHKQEVDHLFLFKDYCEKVDDEISVFYSAKKYKQYIQFNVEYDLLNKKINLLEQEIYYYYNKQQLNKIIKQNNFMILQIDLGYGNGQFLHKNIYHIRVGEENV